jgi:hypothetical protein
MSDLNTTSLSDFTRLADFTWIKAVEGVPQFARQSNLFKEIPWQANNGDTEEFNEIDAEEYSSIKDESDQAEQALVQEGYTKLLRLRRFGKDISVSWELRNRNKYQKVLDRITNLGKQQSKRMDLDLSHRITFGTATSYTDKDGRTVDISVGDTLALFSTAHTLRGSSTTYRNRLANNPQLSKGSLEGMEKLVVEQSFNQFGEKMTVPHDILYTTDDPNTVNTARELQQSTAEISAPNAGVVNVYQAKYRHVVLPRVPTTAAGAPDSTKAKYWGIASSEMTSAMLAVEQEPTLVSPSAGTNSEEFSTEDWSFKGRTSYGIAIVGANWIKFSSGDGTA